MMMMVFSAGARYAEAARMLEESCSGPWVITDEMLEEARQTPKEVRVAASAASEQPEKK